MVKSLIFLSILLIGNNLFSQIRGDYNWQLGNKSDPPFSEGIEMLFSEEGLMIDTFFRSIGFEYFNASISNDQGILLLYSNGCQIRDGEHRFIQGTDHLNPGPTDLEWCGFGYPESEAGLFIPFFGDSIIMLLHQREEIIWPPIQVIHDSLFYTTVRKETSQYILHEKSIPVIGDNLIGGNVEAVKAFKSEAWWVIQGEKASNRYFLILLDSAKVDTVYEQFIGDTVIDGSAAGQAAFSPDGSMFARYAPRDDLFLFDFDRSSGILSNYRKIYVSDSGIIGGIAFSPNNRFLYASAQVDLYQFDTWAEDVEASKIHIDHYDGYLDPFPTTFYHMQLGPDCRIYMNSNNGNYSWHVIHEPDRKGIDCQFEQHAIHFPASTSITIPNFPNYRLDIGPVCDPNIETFINDVFLSPVGFNIYPNPTTGEIHIELSDALKFTHNSSITVFDCLGVPVYDRIMPSGKNKYSIGIEHLVSGIYFITVKSGNQWHSQRIIKT